MNNVTAKTGSVLKTDESVIDEIVKRIVGSVSPKKIILFGSAARKTATAKSDIDILVVKDCTSRRDIAGKIYLSLIGVGRAVDIVVATTADIKRYGNSPSLVLYPALKEGKVIYAS
jgi:predicted nucleotidyltransferase